MRTPFGHILNAATAHIPGAVGAAFVAGDGELVDFWTRWDSDDWLFLSAHVGIIVGHVRAALHTFHFGDAQWIFMQFDDLDLLVEQLEDKYFVVLACTPDLDLDTSTAVMHLVAQRIREEIG